MVGKRKRYAAEFKAKVALEALRGDMPRGVHRFFGFTEPSNLTRNKITLPFPEDYGIGAYDGKVIEFRRVPNGFALSAFEKRNIVGS